ncbi:GDP-Man:Man(3)GlcNAc(2)-PP-Dol alpha-1,2-mannosyltransferase [Cimex lectularius]|uniref:GDP-Man:Man(3)GlcNAc(2)-PP-Dol alpha-1,2-mannosyltransferase n=1 Tax=Cimex lectularius TaxID=79782 RepID=A0A8I6SF88_CIMLE|nr:GDP-Man:Man(3)GlcNAc(2)-PP-Dol alpha-1,2-mannosyltransferase [Cimex lectularius]
MDFSCFKMYSINLVSLIQWAFVLVVSTVVLIILLSLIAKKYFQKVREKARKSGQPFSVALFHPYCNAGGGGERVLWCAVKAIQARYSSTKIVIYTGDLNASPAEIVKKVYTRFNITLSSPVEFIYLHKRKYIEASRYPHFTLLCQSLGSISLGCEALFAFLPDVYIDSMGFSFTLPLFKLIGGCTTACYVHYPTISKDMLKRVISRDVTITNRAHVARSPILSFAKLVYYRLFAMVYSICGGYSDSIMVNSSWTEDQITYIWSGCRDGKNPTHRVYPPCDTKSLQAMPLAKDIGESKEIKIVSVGQYRPEKDHPLQLKALYELRQIVSEETWDRIKLVFIGSCRDSEDHIRVKDMMDLCKHLSLENNVEFKVNVTYEELKQELASSMIGLHAMWNEHFGIGVVECMAAGHIMVAHRSGGPKADIIEEAEGSRNGFLAYDEREYAEAIAAIIKLSPATRKKIREAARSSVDRFSTAEFEKAFLRTIEPLFSCNKVN